MPSKWETAQEFEVKTWQHGNVDIDSLRRRSDFFAGLLPKDDKTFTKILEIGGAGEPIINFFDAEEKVALDPLIEKYKQIFPTLYKGIKTIKSKAENLPFEGGYFDLVICLNVLDHADRPENVLFEVKRVLKNNGVFLFSVDCSGHMWKIATDIRKRIVGNRSTNQKMHIHHYTRSGILKILQRDFDVIFSFAVSESNGKVFRIKNYNTSIFKKIQGKGEMFFVLKQKN